MKKFRLSVFLLSLSVLPFFAFSVNISDINDVFSSVEFIKESIGFENITIDSNVPYDLVQWGIKKYCSQSSIDQAIVEMGKYKNVWISNTSDSKKYLSDRFNTIKWLIANQKKDNQYNFCKNSFLLFSVLKDTQDLYLWEINSTAENIKNDKKSETNKSSKDTSQQKDSQTKKINFTFIHDTSGLPDNAKDSYSKSTENYLQEILASLVNVDKILDKNDLKVFKSKIYITYKQTCDFTEWAFRVIKDLDTEEYTFKDINLIIAYCDNDTLPDRQKRHVQQILTHELWHYIYFFKDKDPSDFSKICWDDSKKICKAEDFVSDYAQESPEEDYADSFAYRYLYNQDWKLNIQDATLANNPIIRRFKHFWTYLG